MSEENDAPQAEKQEEASEIMVAACPQCDTIARGEEEVSEIFGLRRSGGKKRAQSWCRACRIKASAYRKRLKKEQEEAAATDADAESEEE